jgi:hypothetical protein
VDVSSNGTANYVTGERRQHCLPGRTQGVCNHGCAVLPPPPFRSERAAASAQASLPLLAPPAPCLLSWGWVHSSNTPSAAIHLAVHTQCPAALPAHTSPPYATNPPGLPPAGLVRGATKSLVIDLAVLLEGQHSYELPEVLLGACRCAVLAMRGATPCMESRRCSTRIPPASLSTTPSAPLPHLHTHPTPLPATRQLLQDAQP